MKTPFMDISECSEYVRLSKLTLYKKVHLREIPSRKHGRRILFHKDEIDAWSIAHSKPEKEVKLSKFQQTKQKLGLR